jgi:hypothetical protein
MGGFYNVENLGEFKVNDPFLNLQSEVRGLKTEVLYGGGIFDIEPAKQIIASNQALFTIYAVMSGANTGTTAMLADAFDDVTSGVLTNTSSILATSTLYSLRDAYINIFRNVVITTINTAYSLQIINNLNGVAYLVDGLLRTPVTVSTTFQGILDDLNDLFDAVAARNYASASAIRLFLLTTLNAKITSAINELSTSYQSITGVAFSTRAVTYFTQMLGTASGGGLPSNLQAIVDLI